MREASVVSFIPIRRAAPLRLTLKCADYSTDDFATDTRKLWLMAENYFLVPWIAAVA